MNDEVLAANSSVRGDTANSLEDLITQVDVKFIAQEHRLFYILRNAWEYSSKSKADPRRRAAFDAFVFRFGMAFVQRSVVASAGIAGFAGLLLAWQANRLVSEQNDLLRLQYVGERQVVYRADNEMMEEWVKKRSNFDYVLCLDVSRWGPAGIRS